MLSPVVVWGGTGGCDHGPVGIDPAARLAAANNAAWCAAVCRTHALVTETAADVWWSATRTPPLFPDLVTLVPGGAPELLLAIIDSSTGCSVKDSFADLDLGPSGFTVVVEASWIVRDSTAVAAGQALRWRRIGADDGFDRWVAAWSASSGAPLDVLRPALFAEPTVTVLAADRDGGGDLLAAGGGGGDLLAADRGGDLVAGAVINDAAGVLGVSNVFVVREHAGVDPWPSLVGYLVRHHRGRTVVGYEAGDDFDRALAAGFRRAGALRVWIRAQGADGEIEPAVERFDDLPDPVVLPPEVESPSSALARMRSDER